MEPVAPRRAGSGVLHLGDAERAERVNPRKRLDVTVVLRPANPNAHVLTHARHPRLAHPLSARGLAALYDPGDASIRVVRRFAKQHDLEVVEVSRARHDIVLSGTVSGLSRAFGVELHNWNYSRGQYRAHDEPVTLPPDLRAVSEGVLGLDDIPVHRTRAAPGASPTVSSQAIAGHYAFPTVDASGCRIAVIEFGGGYLPQDLATFARREGFPLPPITTVRVHGSSRKGGSGTPLNEKTGKAISVAWQNGGTFSSLTKKFGAGFESFLELLEVSMDVQICASLGGGAAVDVYFAPAGTDGWRRALYAVMGQAVGGRGAPFPGKPTAVSISWGDNEENYGVAGLTILNNALGAVQRAGILTCVASGDRGSSNAFPTASSKGCTHANVSFPASSAAVLACGGTMLDVRESALENERVWNETTRGTAMASGGGMSGFFPRPSYQSRISHKPVTGTWMSSAGKKKFAGRWIPDLAANAAFASGMSIVLNGQAFACGGTSAATPICAALFTRVSAAAGYPVAGVVAWLYAHGNTACRDLSGGNNGVCGGTVPFYEANAGWNPCTGFGAPDGTLILGALRKSAPAKS